VSPLPLCFVLLLVDRLHRSPHCWHISPVDRSQHGNAAPVQVTYKRGARRGAQCLCITVCCTRKKGLACSKVACQGFESAASLILSISPAGPRGLLLQTLKPLRRARSLLVVGVSMHLPCLGIFSKVACRIQLCSEALRGSRTESSPPFPRWNPAVEQQAQDRIHRLGQYKPIQ
jgi:hypothetical protein